MWVVGIGKFKSSHSIIRKTKYNVSNSKINEEGTHFKKTIEKSVQEQERTRVLNNFLESKHEEQGSTFYNPLRK